MSIRSALAGDLPAIVGIERASFNDPWTAAMFTADLSNVPDAGFLVAEQAGVIIGFAVSRTVLDESELLNIAVDPKARKSGVGGRLLDAMMRSCAQRGAATMWLEVRASNVSAQGLYARRGFVPAGVRERYYRSPREDAIVLRAVLGAVTRNTPITVPVPGFAAGRDEQIHSTASHHPRQELK